MRKVIATRSVRGWTMCLSVAVLMAGCGGAETTDGTGGVQGSGGKASGTGGASAGSGGTSATGGQVGSGSGGVTSNGSGGSSSGGASAGSGGQTTGGQSGSGGSVTGSGGASAGSGGATATGGQSGGSASGGRGGSVGTGGAAGGAGGGSAAFDRAAVASIMRRVADYEINRFGTTNPNGWVRATFHTGMMAAYRALGDAKYHDYTLKWAQANNWLVSTDNSNGPRFADNQACFQSYIELYSENPIASNDVMIASARTVFDSMVSAPKTGRVEWWWADSLFMAPPALARLAKTTGKTAYWTLLNNMYWDTKAFLYDPANSLFWRDSNYLNMNVYWSRGNGWVFAGIARTLEYLPTTDARRADYETLLKEMAAKLKTLQQSDGYWRSSLTQPTAYPNPESSGTAFFCFGLAWGINNGVLDRATYLPTVQKAWDALVAAVNTQGRLGWVQTVAAKPGTTNQADTNDYATGAFLLAGSELMKL